MEGCRPRTLDRVIWPSFREAKDRQDATELGIVGECFVRTSCTQASSVNHALGIRRNMRRARCTMPFLRIGAFRQSRRHADAGPTADTRQHGYVLFAAMGKCVDVADNP